jgi:hypothetical protein
MAKPNVKIEEPALDQLNVLKRLLKAEWGVVARQEDIVSALVQDASVGHVAGILAEYQRARPNDAANADADGAGP